MKADGPPGPLVSLGGGSSAEQQASTSKLLHQYSAAEQQQQELFGAPGPRDDVFSLRGASYMTGGKGRALGCVSPAKRSLLFRVSVLRRSQMCPQPPPRSLLPPCACRAAMLECESENLGNCHRSLLEGPAAASLNGRSNEGLRFVLITTLISTRDVQHVVSQGTK